MKQGRTLIASLIIGILAGIILSPVPASAITRRMFNWMQPPSDDIGNNACLVGPDSLWHGTYDDPNRALDWKKTCGSTVEEPIYFRSRAAAPEDTFDRIGAHMESFQQPDLICGGKPLHYARAQIRSTWDGVAKGSVTYQHALVQNRILKRDG